MNSSINLEEAANVASEFIYSLDNLPHEVAHLLQEIKHKERRAHELQQEAEKDSAKYIRHSLRASSSNPSSPSRPPSPKSSLLPGKISASYAEIHRLSSEKCVLAQALVDLVTRTRARLDSDLAKVRMLQGETSDYLGTLSSASSGVATSADAHTVTGRNPAVQVGESLRNALAAGPTLADVKQGSGASVAATPPSTVPSERRLAATASIKLNSASPTKRRSASPTTTAPLNSSHPRVASRLSRQSITRQDTDVEEGDEDAEGEDADADDEKLYCFCQKHSYGDMIACDNEGGCPFEWFHLSCVGLKQPTPEKWYCSVCSQKKIGGPTIGRKGRKK
ncbi:hypothetical protein L208DRAFT_1241294 [Tricholoma matsutake]|nr:hypothetical protein L208DRAFT_1241294 [Tricholoma matsutake 945]